MKKILFIALICIIFSSNTAMAGKIPSNCTLNGKPLFGNVKVVDSFPDFKVKVTQNFEDMRVKVVESFPTSCGKWKFVDNFPDFTIKFVESFEDFSIRYTDSFEGI